MNERAKSARKVSRLHGLMRDVHAARLAEAARGVESLGRSRGDLLRMMDESTLGTDLETSLVAGMLRRVDAGLERARLERAERAASAKKQFERARSFEDLASRLREASRAAEERERIADLIDDALSLASQARCKCDRE